MFFWLRAGLEELGHEVTLSHDKLSPSAVNVVWEGFTPEAGAALRASGLRYGIIVTEFMDGTGFNKGTPRSDQPDRRDETYRKRWLGFEAAAGRASFFWSMVESNLPALRARAPASFVELGFSERLVPAPGENPHIDFSFTGILTPHRQRVLEALEKRARVIWHGTLIPIEERDRLFRATRINLSINKTTDWQMPSGTRVGLALLSKRGIALDGTPQQTRLSGLVESCPADTDFVEFALDRLHGDWQSASETAFDRYRAELPMKAVMERALDESCLSNVTAPGSDRSTGSRWPWVARLVKRFA
ncbi:hypothetical protein [Frigoriglobus tundricola]|uniref:Uncharacterized protein n=1 Tax=Frigoriglobus tundricola TaxID=2774151 RepID=A0A6M5Z4Z3_9BACT|nr:hypothetical protein [Frigoriglobus tundricola]QJX01126.1 hypothetical protein FTUN_8765 [Frigoriglobus tundricola]